MKVEVKRQFKDRHTGDLRKVGEIIIISKKRFEEIRAASTIHNYVEEIKAVKANDA